MTTFLTIQDKIQELSKGEIQKRRFSPLLAIILIVISLPFLWFGGRNAFIGEGSTYYLSTIGIILGLVGLTLLLIPREYFIIARPNGIIKPNTINLDLVDKDRILDYFENGQIKEILKLSSKNPSSLYLELWVREGYDKVYAQIYQMKDSIKRPISLAKVFPIENIKN